MGETLASAARRLNLTGRRGPPGKAAEKPFRRGLPGLWFMTDRRRVADPMAVAARLPAGAGVVLRDYDAEDRPALAAALAAICRRRRLTFLVGADPVMARRVGAAGLHLPAWAPASLRTAKPAFRRRRTGGEPGAWLTASAHDRAEIIAAWRAGADAVFLAPVFPTRSHPGSRALGVVRFAALVARAPLPVIALGGVSAETVRRLRGSGCRGVAAIGAFDPGPRKERGP